MARQKNKKAYKIIRKAAKVNRVVLSEMVTMTFKSDDTIKQTIPDYESDDEETPEKAKISTMFQTVLRSKIMIGRFLLIFYIW